MKKQSQSLFMVLLLLLGLLNVGVQHSVLAAEQSAGTITVIGKEQTGALLPETEVAYGDKETALDALIKTAGQNNIEVEETKYGKSIKRIKDLTKADPFYWAFYINGIFAPVNYDAYAVQNGDKLSYVYEDWNQAPKKTVSIKLIDKDGKDIIPPLNKVPFINEPTAFDFLKVAVGNQNVEFKQYDFGKMITSIKGIAVEGSNYWGFYVNGKMASTSADSYKLQAGDEISFKFESSAPPAGGSDGGNQKAAVPVSGAALQAAVDHASKYVSKNAGDWEVIALKKAGKRVPSSYLENAAKLVKDKNGRFSKITDVERYTLGILAAGGNPENVSGHNLVEATYNGDVMKQGLNGVAYGLIALDSANFKVPASAIWTKQKLVNELISKQNKDGGWTWDPSSTTSDIDTTAMVLTALAPHKGEAGVQEKIDQAVEYLSKQYLAGKIDNSSTAAQAVIALSSLNLDANDASFTKDGTSLISYLLTFQNADGGFDWQGGDVSDAFSTSQGFQAVVAYQLKVNGKGSLYQLPLSQAAGKAGASSVATDSKPDDAAKKPTDRTDGQQGHKLPVTASEDYNMIALGSLMILTGFVALFIQRRKKASR